MKHIINWAGKRRLNFVDFATASLTVDLLFKGYFLFGFLVFVAGVFLSIQAENYYERNRTD